MPPEQRHRSWNALYSARIQTSTGNLYTTLVHRIIGTRKSPLEVVLAVWHTALWFLDFPTWIPCWNVRPICSIGSYQKSWTELVQRNHQKATNSAGHQRVVLRSMASQTTLERQVFTWRNNT